MNFTGSHFDSPCSSRPGDELDGLLCNFFQAELPSPWPACPEPPAQTARLLPRSRWAQLHSHLALAAAIALIVIGLWALGGKLASPIERTDGGFHTPNSAQRIRLYEVPKLFDLDKVHPKANPAQPDEDPTDLR